MTDGREKCARCGDVGHDRRTLMLACFYDMSEYRVPFVELEIKASDGKDTWPLTLYTLRVCKACRASWLDAIERWFEAEIEP